MLSKRGRGGRKKRMQTKGTRDKGNGPKKKRSSAFGKAIREGGWKRGKKRQKPSRNWQEKREVKNKIACFKEKKAGGGN